MVFGRLGRAISMGMLLGGVLFLAACPGDLENAQEQATEEDNAEPKGTLDDCLNECQETARKDEEACVAKLSDEEKQQTEGFDSPVLACKNNAMGDLSGCQVTCNAEFR